MYSFRRSTEFAVSFRLAAQPLLAPFALAVLVSGCQVSIENKTPLHLVRVSPETVEARVEAAPGATIEGVVAEVNGTSVAMVANGDLWTGSYPADPCETTLSVKYTASYSVFGTTVTATDPPEGTHLFWIDGAPPTSCSGSPHHPFIVTSPNEGVDANPGDGVCATSTGECTLRAAVMEANHLPGPDLIQLTAQTYHVNTYEGPGPYPQSEGHPGGGSPDAVREEIGDIDVMDDLIIEGTGANTTIIDGSFIPPDSPSEVGLRDHRNAVFEIANAPGKGPSVTLTGLTITNTQSVGPGGAITNLGELRVERCVLENNVASYGGGGIYNAGLLTLTESTIRNNGHIHLFGGGGILNRGHAIIDRSTIGPGNQGKEGGGIEMSGGQLEMTNSTVSGNTAVVIAGGIGAGGSEDLLLRNVTIAYNAVTDSNGSCGGLSTSSQTRIANSIVADNRAGKMSTRDVCAGGISLGHNVFGFCAATPANCGFSGTTAVDQKNVNPKLTALAAHGGLTLTHALGAGSPALNASWDQPPNDANELACPTVDQTGYLRASAPCDVGAVEQRLRVTRGGVEVSRGGGLTPIELK
jgi:Right handed beta helix region